MDAETHALPVPGPVLDGDRETAARSPVPPVLEPAPNGLADRFSQTVGPDRPVRVFTVALFTGYVVIVTAMVALGLFLVHVLLSIAALDRADEDLSQWLADNRSPLQEDLSWAGSTLAGGHVIPAVIGVALVTALLMRRWLLAAFVPLVVALESGTYRLTSLIVERRRPNVERLESLPVDASYPSGHTAASIALYGGLLLLLASRIDNAIVRALAIVLGVAIPLFVAWSRMYRGMHHLTDVIAGILLGLGAVAILVFAARASRASTERRDGEAVGGERSLA